MLVRDIMTTPVHAVRAGDEVAHARREMLRRDVSHLPVVDERDHLLGFVGLADVVALASGRPRARRHPFGATVDSIMTARPPTLRPVMQALEAASVLTHADVSAAPVVDDMDLVGVVSAQDLLDALGPGLRGRGKVADVQRAEAPSVHRHASVANVLDVMHGAGVREVPVLEGQATITDRPETTHPRMQTPVRRGLTAADHGIVGLVNMKTIAFGAWFDMHLTQGDHTKRVREARREEPGGRANRRHVEVVDWAAEDVMTRDLRALEPDDDLGIAARVFAETGRSGLPVLGETTGWLDRQALLRVLVERLVEA